MISKCNSMIFHTHLGWAGVSVSDRGVTKIVLPKKEKQTVARELESARCEVRSADKSPGNTSKVFSVKNPSAAILAKAVRILEKYFSGVKIVFDLPLDIRDYTAFQQAVWQAALEIPFGETRSYAWIAKKIKNPNASRAVGQAMGANPIPLIIP